MGRRVILCQKCPRRNKCKSLCERARAYLNRKASRRISDGELLFYGLSVLKRAGFSISQIKKFLGLGKSLARSTIYRKLQGNELLFNELAEYFLSKHKKKAEVISLPPDVMERIVKSQGHSL